MALQEAGPDFLGESIMAIGDTGYAPGCTNGRKAQLWSSEPWADPEPYGHDDGRFVSGTTHGISIACVCVPWGHSNVRGGRRNRTPWEEWHLYVDWLSQHVKRERPDVIAGDFNCALPARDCGEIDRAMKLRAALPEYDWPTEGAGGVCHFAVRHEVGVKAVRVLHRRCDSSHDGLALYLR